MKKLLFLSLSLLLFASYELNNAQSDQPFLKLSEEKVNFGKTYQELLNSGMKPKIAPEYDFPTSYQYLNGCFAFALNNIMEYKYGEKLDLLEAEKIIEKPREVLWNKEYKEKFLNAYNLNRNLYSDAETFFRLMQDGEPFMISYLIDLDDGRQIGHLVSAYSFDANGVWISDPLKGKNIHLEYEKVFSDDGRNTRYAFYTINKERIF